MKKVAHQPHINLKMREKLVTPRSYQEGMAKMMHFIDAAKNHSKFYEMVIVPDNFGTYTLIKCYGALTDDMNKIHVLKEGNLTLLEAKKQMEVKARIQLGKGYSDTFKTHRGAYPLGLDRDPPFNHGTQSAYGNRDTVPALRTLLRKLDAAIDAGERMEADDMSVSMAEVSRILFDMPESSMATELQRKLSTPAKQLLSGNVNPKLLSRALKTVRNYIENQLSAIGRTASARSAHEFLNVIRYRINGGKWLVEKFPSGRALDRWLDKMLKVPEFEIDWDSVDSVSEDYSRSLMASTRTASARAVLIKLASSLPAGSSERRAILASLEAEIKKDADPKSHDQNKPETWMGLK